jgi:hypothetical protein
LALPARRHAAVRLIQQMQDRDVKRFLIVHSHLASYASIVAVEDASTVTQTPL